MPGLSLVPGGSEDIHQGTLIGSRVRPSMTPTGPTSIGVDIRNWSNVHQNLPEHKYEKKEKEETNEDFHDRPRGGGDGQGEGKDDERDGVDMVEKVKVPDVVVVEGPTANQKSRQHSSNRSPTDRAAH